MVDLRVKLPGSETDQPKFMYSSPVEAPGAMKVAAKKSGAASLMEGVAAAGDGLIKLTDGLLQTVAENETERAVDQVREEFAANGDLWGGRDITNNPQTAPEIEKQLKYAREIHQGYMAGTIKDSNYWARLDSISRQLRTRYPGYREYIDNKMSSMVGGTPANRLREALANEAQAAARGNTEQTPLEKIQWKTIEDANKDGIMDARFPGWQQQIQNNTFDMQGAVSQISVYRQMEYETKVKQNQLAAANADQESNAKLAYTTARQHVSMEVGASLLAMSNASGKSIDTMINNLKKMAAENKIPKAGPELEQYLSTINGWKMEVSTRIDQILGGEWPGHPGQSYNNYLDEKQREDIKQAALGPILALERFFTDKDVGILDRAQTSMDFLLEGQGKRMVESNNHIAMWSVTNKLVGPEGSAILWQNSDAVQGLANFLTTSMVSELMSGKSDSVVQTIRTVRDREGADATQTAQSVNLLKDRLLSILTTDSVPSDGFRQVAGILFNDRENLLTMLSPEDGARVLSQMTAPEITRRMKEMSVYDPNLLKNYEKWATKGFLYLNQSALQTVKDIKVNRKYYDVVLDDRALKFSIVPRKQNGTPAVGGFDPLGSIQGVGEAILNPQARKAVDQLNFAIANFKPFLHAFYEGSDQAPTMQGLLTDALKVNGVDMNAPYEGPMVPTMQELGQGIAGAVIRWMGESTKRSKGRVELDPETEKVLGGSGTDDLGGGAGKDWFGYSPEQLDYMREIEAVMGERGKEIVNSLKKNSREPKGGVDDQRTKVNEDGMPSDDFFMSLSLDPETDTQITIDKQKQEFNKKMKELSKMPLPDLMKEIKKQRWPVDWKTKVYEYFSSYL